MEEQYHDGAVAMRRFQTAGRGGLEAHPDMVDTAAEAGPRKLRGCTGRCHVCLRLVAA